eukprot:355325-Chlamydomonas_euryale.AAC.5
MRWKPRAADFPHLRLAVQDDPADRSLHAAPAPLGSIGAGVGPKSSHHNGGTNGPLTRQHTTDGAISPSGAIGVHANGGTHGGGDNHAGGGGEEGGGGGGSGGSGGGASPRAGPEAATLLYASGPVQGRLRHSRFEPTPQPDDCLASL